MIMTPNKGIAYMWKRYQIQLQSCLITFCIGMLIHLYAVTNKFFNYFEMGNIFSRMSYSQNDSLGLGRWFLPVATSLGTHYSSPLLNGVIVMLCMSVSAGMLCSMLRIQKCWTRSLFGIVWASFPGIACIFSFGVNSDALGIAILLAVGAIYVEEKSAWGAIPGAVMLAMSIGIYQPYLAVAIAASFGILFLDTLQENYVRKQFIYKVLRIVVTLALGFILYYVILQAVLQLTGKSLSGYHGVDSMTEFSIKGIAKGFVYSYLYFTRYFFTNQYMQNWGVALVNIFGAISMCICVWKRCVKAGERSILAFLLFALMPLGVNAAPFLMADRVGSGVDIYMMPGLMVLWGVLIVATDLEERLSPNWMTHRWKSLIQWCSLCVILITCTSGYLVCNQAYHRMEAMTQTTTSLLERIVTRIEEVPEWHADMPVYFVNPGALVNDNYQVEIEEYNQLKNLPGTEIWTNYNEQGITKFCEVYLHFPIRVADEQSKEKLNQNHIVQSMPSFPARDSIQVIDGVIVVKISDGEK